MKDFGERWTQLLAVTLMALGLAAIAAADKYNFRDLANAGTVVVGAGVGLLTGKALNQSTKTGDIKNAESTSEDPAKT